jgi:hypothetical protein
MKLTFFWIFIFLFNYCQSQNRWFKHLEGWTADQSFEVNDTIYTFGVTSKYLVDTTEIYNSFINSCLINNSNIFQKNIGIDSFEKDSLASTFARTNRSILFNNNFFYLGLSLFKSNNKEHSYLTKYNSSKGILDTIIVTKDTFNTQIEVVKFINDKLFVGGNYAPGGSKNWTRITTYLQFYDGKRIKLIKTYPDVNNTARWRLKEILENKKSKSSFFVHLQHQQFSSGTIFGDYIVKMDTIGNELWQCYPSNRDSINTEGMQMVQKPNGNLLVSWCDFWYRPYKNMIGSQQPQVNDHCTLWFAEIDSTGKVLWRKQMKQFLSSKIKRDSVHNLVHFKSIATPSGVLWSGYYAWQYSHNYLLKTDFDGNPIWYREYELYPSNTAQQEFKPYDVTATSDGGYVLTGEYISDKGNFFKNGCQLATIIKVDSFGCLLPGCQKADSSTTAIKRLQKSGFKLYPNPNSGSFNIEIENPAKDVSIEVLDMMGKHIANVERVEKVNSLGLDIADGMYWVRVKNGGAVYNQKVSIVK